MENSSKLLLLYHTLLIAAIVMCSKTIFLCFLMLVYAKQSKKAIMYAYILCLFNWIWFFSICLHDVWWLRLSLIVGKVEYRKAQLHILQSKVSYSVLFTSLDDFGICRNKVTTVSSILYTIKNSANCLIFYRCLKPIKGLLSYHAMWWRKTLLNKLNSNGDWLRLSVPISIWVLDSQ